MKTRMVVILASIVLLVLPLKLFAEENASTLTASEKAFVEKLVKAINEKSEAQLKALMHPQCRACINESNQDYYHDVFQKMFVRAIPTDYTARIEPLTSENKVELKVELEIGKKIGLNYPVDKAYDMYIDYKLNNNPFSGASVRRFLAKDGDDFYWVEACPSAQWIEDYRKRKGNKEEEAKYWERFIAMGWEHEKSLPLSERRRFMKDEYGALFWSMEAYPNFWRFKSNTVFRDIRIVLIENGEEVKELVKNQSLQNFVPLEFDFYLGDTKVVQNGMQSELRTPYGFSKFGVPSFSESSSLSFKGNVVKKVFINKTISAKDILHFSRNITLAMIDTQDSEKTFHYVIQLQVQAKGSYFLEYGYDNKEGKLTAYLTNGESKFFTWASLKEWVATLPAGTKLEFFSTCKQMSDQPLFDAKELESFKDFCINHKIEYILYPGG